MANKNQKIFNLQKKEFFSKNKKAIAKTSLSVFALILVISLICYSIFVLATINSEDIRLTSPDNLTYTNDNTTNFIFNATSSQNASDINCTLYVNGTLYGFNQSTLNATPTTITSNEISEGLNYVWYINCTDADGTNQSSLRLITIDKTNASVSFGTAPADASYDNDSTIVFDSKCSDNYNASWLQVWGNWTGGWHANQSNSSPTNNSYWNVSIANIPEGYHVWGVYCNDSAGFYNSNRTTNRTFIEDRTASMYSIGTNSTNSTYAGQPVRHNLKWNDTYGFSGYMFSFNNGNGSNYVNYSWTAMTGTSNWTNVTNVTNSTVGAVMSWKIWVNDSAGNWNVSDTYNYSTTLGVILYNNNTQYNSTIFNLTYAATMDANCTTTVWNYTNSVITSSSSNASVTFGTNGTFQVNLSNEIIPDGNYTWNTLCFNSANNSAQASLNNTLSVASHYFYGYVNYANKTVVNGSNVSILVYNMNMSGPPTLLKTHSVYSDTTGFFNLTNISLKSTSSFKITVNVYNSSEPLRMEWIGPSLPSFTTLDGMGNDMLQSIQNMTFYLKQAATINISAVNATGGTKTFQYQVKDTKLGYPLGEGFVSYVSSALIHVPQDRNYSIMIYPNESFPVSYDINSSEIDDGYANKTFNCTDSTNNRLTGNLSYNNSVEFDEIVIVSYLLEPGRMIFFGDNSWAMSNMTLGSFSDEYNITTGFYNISLVGPAENSSLIMMAIARRGVTYYGMFREIKLTYGGVAYPNGTLFGSNEFDLNLSKLVGSNYTITANGGQGIIINLSAMNISLMYGGNSLSQQAHVEVEVDYDDYNSTNFTYMTDIGSSSSGLLQVPLLNVTGVKRINVYSQEASPTKKMLNVTQVNEGEENITLRSNMDMKQPNGSEMNEDLFIDMIINNATCTAPNYNQATCSFFGSSPQDKEGEGFNPFKTVMSGASMSFVMKNADNITVIYANVDMMASGPPDAVFDENADDNEKTSSFEEVWRFGSTGPEIYDYVIIGVPYTEGSTSVTGINESNPINISIPFLYGDDFDEPLWNGTANGYNKTLINSSDNMTDFTDYLNNSYEAYINGTNVTCNATDSTFTSGLCYKDTTNNMIWFKIKHFSGLGPSVTGDLVESDSGGGDNPPGGGGGGGSTVNTTNQTTNQTKTDSLSLGELDESGETAKVGLSGIISFSYDNLPYTIKILELSSTKVKFLLSSSQTAITLNVGETKKIDLNRDGVNDIEIKFNALVGTKADILIKEISEIEEITCAEGYTKVGDKCVKNFGIVGATPLWPIIAIVAIIAALLIYVIAVSNKKKKKNWRL